jgi:U3 small nucleolar RNA-associated protein 6
VVFRHGEGTVRARAGAFPFSTHPCEHDERACLQMLAELKDLGEKGLFSPGEIKQIIKRRTAFEMALVRRIPNKNDYLRYAAYEMGLEALRRKRITRLSASATLPPFLFPCSNDDDIKKELPKSPPSISDYALTRRQFQIFERALQKFKSDVSLWLQYLRVAQRAGSRALAGRIAARAVQLHPRTPALYVLAASHELANGGMGAARVLLQRGLRLNADCVEMWREYVRLELGFVEALRRRWDVLGISLEDASDRRRGREPESGGQGERIDKAEEEAMGDDARGEIMDGAIVRQAIDGAAKGEHTPSTHHTHPRLLRQVPSHYSYYFAVTSTANDRAVSESADTHCRISGARVSP